MAKEKKGRKFGRNARRPSAKTYLIAKRWETNKVKRIRRHKRMQVKHQLRLEMRKPQTQRDHERVVQLRQELSQLGA